jgi:hypothetical protein
LLLVGSLFLDAQFVEISRDNEGFGVMERRRAWNFVHVPKLSYVDAQYKWWQWFCFGIEGRIAVIIFLTVNEISQHNQPGCSGPGKNLTTGFFD